MPKYGHDAKLKPWTNPNAMNPRNGKIAHLPRSIRDLLNKRLDRSQPASQILPWLNGSEEVQEIIKEEFDRVPISEQNLSQWRQGGFQKWLVRRELCLEAGDVTELAEGMQEETGQGILADDVAVVLAARFGTLLAKWDGEVDAKFEAKSRALNRICRSVVQLQHGMHRARRESLEFARLSEEQQKAEKEEMKRRLLQPFKDMMMVPLLAPAYGGGKLGRKIAAYILAVQRGNLDAKLDILPTDTREEDPPRESKPIKPPRKPKVVKRAKNHPPAAKSKPLAHNKMAPVPQSKSHQPHPDELKATQSDFALPEPAVHAVHRVHEVPASIPIGPIHPFLPPSQVGREPRPGIATDRGHALFLNHGK
ncbi:MAG: hypothetical protein ABSA83_19765 [Verrucomicrobiota bacterium]